MDQGSRAEIGMGADHVEDNLRARAGPDWAERGTAGGGYRSTNGSRVEEYRKLITLLAEFSAVIPVIAHSEKLNIALYMMREGL